MVKCLAEMRDNAKAAGLIAALASVAAHFQRSERKFGIVLATACLLLGSPAPSRPAVVQGQTEGPLDVEPEELSPGLIAVYRSLGAEGQRVDRVEPKPAFFLGLSSPHPRIPPGPFEVLWSGVLQVQDPGPITFSAIVGGDLQVEVDGVTVLRGVGRSATSRLNGSETLARRPGLYRLKIRFRSLADVPARLQIFWEGPSFAREPLPAWRFTHLAEAGAAAPELARERKAATGRDVAGQFGCARCHQGAFPGVDDPPPGPSLADAKRRLDRDWLLRWLEQPSTLRSDARMPALFRQDRAGFVERWIIAEYLGHKSDDHKDESGKPAGDHRAGRIAFLSLGCTACHFVPEQDRAGQPDLGRFAFERLGERMSADDLVAFLGNPLGRYPDGRMPRLPVGPEEARNIAAYLLLWSGRKPGPPAAEAPTAEEINDLSRRLNVSGRSTAALASALMARIGCASCHSGLGSTLPKDVTLRAGGDERLGCLADRSDTAPRFAIAGPAREALSAYLKVAAKEVHPSPFAARQRKLARAGCVRCHQRDSDRSSPLEEAGRTLGAGYLETIPYQRVPRLSHPHQKLTRGYLAETVREGVSGLRSERFTYRMPVFGMESDALVQAIAEADGELSTETDPPPRAVVDPTAGTLAGPELVGSQGYGCISCHVWNGQQLSQPDPGAIGPDLTRLVGRVRRDWFDNFVENPGRFYPGTPMPGIFPRGRKATLTSVFDGDPTRQKDALWSYFTLGSLAPAPKPPPPLPIAGPETGASPLVAQIPIHLPDRAIVESLSLLTSSHDLLIYDLAAFSPRALFTGGRILRYEQGRTRRFLADGTPAGIGLATGPSLKLAGQDRDEPPLALNLHGFDRRADGARLRYQVQFKGGTVEAEELLRIVRDKSGSHLARELRFTAVPNHLAIVVRSKTSSAQGFSASATTGEAEQRAEGDVVSVRLKPDRNGTVVAVLRSELPPARKAAPWEGKPRDNPDPEPGSLERPGYRAVAFPRLKLPSGEDRLMPSALAVDPRDGRLFIASMKTGELFTVKDPRGHARTARIENYANGLFQDTFSMLAEKDALYVLHRRNLTRVVDTDADGKADLFERLVKLSHGVADTYDYAYGLVRDRTGGFIVSYAPYANTTMPGSGGILRLVPGQSPREIAYGLRNPLGWCVGPAGEVFFTDNQGEWVAANKLSHVEEGRFHGFPNPAQKQHAERPLRKPVVWVPYGWAHSINGVAFDNTGGKFGPFDGQFFLAELMFGGAVIRANVERINGQYQGACFPFWGKGLLGPVSLAFDPQGPLYVGGITEPGWMAQPDRGALFRIDYTGKTPFELKSIHALPRGFRIVFTTPADRRTAAEPASYRLERYRYEYTGAYGSPELDRVKVPVERVTLASDGRSVELTTPPLVKDRVYLISAPEVRSANGEALVHPVGAYTLNEIPDARGQPRP